MIVGLPGPPSADRPGRSFGTASVLSDSPIRDAIVYLK
jgi:hypothetical protein